MIFEIPPASLTIWDEYSSVNRFFSLLIIYRLYIVNLIYTIFS